MMKYPTGPQPADGPDCLFHWPETEIDQRLKGWSKDRLQEVLTRLEKRLGTSTEHPRDFELSRAVAHRLNNILAGELMRAELARLQRKSP